MNIADGDGGRHENPFKISVEDLKRDFDLNVHSAWRFFQLTVSHTKKSGYGSLQL